MSQTIYVYSVSGSQEPKSNASKVNLFNCKLNLVNARSNNNTCSSFTTIPNNIKVYSSTNNGNIKQHLWYTVTFTLISDLNNRNYSSYKIIFYLDNTLDTRFNWYTIAYLSVDGMKMASTILGPGLASATFDGVKGSYINISLLFPGLILKSNKIYYLELMFLNDYYKSSFNCFPAKTAANPLGMCFSSKSWTPNLINNNFLMNRMLYTLAAFQYQTIIPVPKSTSSPTSNVSLAYPMRYVSTALSFCNVPYGASGSTDNLGFKDLTFTNFIKAGMIIRNDAMCTQNDNTQSLIMTIDDIQTYTGESATYSVQLTCLINKKVIMSPILKLNTIVVKNEFIANCTDKRLTVRTSNIDAIKIGTCFFGDDGIINSTITSLNDTSSFFIGDGNFYLTNITYLYFLVKRVPNVIVFFSCQTTNFTYNNNIFTPPGTFVSTLMFPVDRFSSVNGKLSVGMVIKYGNGLSDSITQVLGSNSTAYNAEDSYKISKSESFTGKIINIYYDNIEIGYATDARCVTGTLYIYRNKLYPKVSVGMEIARYTGGSNFPTMNTYTSVIEYMVPTYSINESQTFTNKKIYVNNASLQISISDFLPETLVSPGVFCFVTMEAYLNTINRDSLSFINSTFLSPSECKNLNVENIVPEKTDSSTNYADFTKSRSTGGLSPTYDIISNFPQDGLCSIQGFAQYPNVYLNAGFTSSSINFIHQSQYMNIVPVSQTLIIPVLSASSEGIFTCKDSSVNLVKGMYLIILGTYNSNNNISANFSPYNPGDIYKISEVITNKRFRMQTGSDQGVTVNRAGSLLTSDCNLTFIISTYKYYLPSIVTYNLVFEIQTPLNDVTDSNSLIVQFRNFGYGNPPNFKYTVSARLQTNNGVMFVSENMLYQLGAGNDIGWIQTGYEANTNGSAQGVGNTLPQCNATWYLQKITTNYDLGLTYTSGPVWCNNLLPFPYPGQAFNPSAAYGSNGVINITNSLENKNSLKQWIGYINVSNQNNNNNWFVMISKYVNRGMLVQCYDCTTTIDGSFSKKGNYQLLFQYHLGPDKSSQWYQFQKPGLYPIIVTYFSCEGFDGVMSGIQMGFYGDKTTSNLFPCNNQNPSENMGGVNSYEGRIENPTFPGMHCPTTTMTKDAQVVVNNTSYTSNAIFINDSTAYKNPEYSGEIGVVNPTEQYNILPAYIISPSIVLNLSTLFPQNSYKPGISYSLQLNFTKADSDF